MAGHGWHPIWYLNPGIQCAGTGRGNGRGTFILPGKGRGKNKNSKTGNQNTAKTKTAMVSRNTSVVFVGAHIGTWCGVPSYHNTFHMVITIKMHLALFAPNVWDQSSKMLLSVIMVHIIGGKQTFVKLAI